MKYIEKKNKIINDKYTEYIPSFISTSKYL